MRISFQQFLCFYLFLLGVCSCVAQSSSASPPVRVLVITGGHTYEETAFRDMFSSMKSLSVTYAVLGGEAEKKLKSDRAKDYDALVFYDMYEQCAPYVGDLLALLEQGKGTVFLHHSLGSCPEDLGYGYLVGGRARFGPPDSSGTTKYWLGTSYRAHIEDANNPITAGMTDFNVLDEVYSDYFVNSGVHLLLTTDNPTSGRQLAWTWQYKKSPIVYIQLGHDHVTYENPNYRTLVERSTLWVAGRLTNKATASTAPREELFQSVGSPASHSKGACGADGQ